MDRYTPTRHTHSHTPLQAPPLLQRSRFTMMMKHTLDFKARALSINNGTLGHFFLPRKVSTEFATLSVPYHTMSVF
jgi:hypothetical protein